MVVLIGGLTLLIGKTKVMCGLVVVDKIHLEKKEEKKMFVQYMLHNVY